MIPDDDKSKLSDEPGGCVQSLFRKLVGDSVNEDTINSISEQFSSLSEADEGLDLYSKLPPVGDPNRKEKLLDMLFADIAIRRHLGTELSVHQYLRRYPELQREEVLSAFEAVGGEKEKSQSNIHQSFPSPSANSALRPVGEYKLVKELGVGGFGEVWLAEAPGGVPVAVKIIKRPIDDYTARQEHQALLLVKGLSHPFLVQTQAYWILDDRLVIAMELCEQNLRQRLKQCQAQGMTGVPKKELLHCFKQAAEALDHLHKNRVHHRDIKPENMLLHHGHVKIADFGLAFMYDGEASMMTAPEAGTGRYMAPEVWNRKLSKHSDQYSLALAYAELRLGRPIITGKGTVEFMRQHMEAEPDLTGLDMDEADVVRQALAKSPHDRYESCMAFMEALDATEKIIAPQQKRWLVTALAAAFVAVLCAFVYSQWYPNTGTVKVVQTAWIPEQATPGKGEPANDSTGKPWFPMVVVSKGGVEVNFMLVLQKGRGPATFYISQTKITNGIVKKAYADDDFKARLKEWKEKVGPELADKCFPELWHKGGAGDGKLELGDSEDKFPVLRITAAEAAVVAEWLGGMLPTKSQWEAAAGLDGDDWRAFKLPISKTSRGRKNGPSEVGEHPEDESNGVYDVAGNGTEWTRYFTDFNESVSIHGADLKQRLASNRQRAADLQIPWRGFAYSDTRDEKDVMKVLKDKLGFGIAAWTAADEYTGFRVVLEPQ